MNFRKPAERDRAWGRYFAKRGTHTVITKRPIYLYPSERLSDWARKYYALPVEARTGK